MLTPAEDEKRTTTVEPATEAVKVQRGDLGRAVVVLSGGMDSTVCATLATREYGAAHVGALHVSYGQRTAAREKQAFTAVAERLGTRPVVFPSNHGGFLGGEYGQTGEPDAFAAKLRQVLANPG